MIENKFHLIFSFTLKEVHFRANKYHLTLLARASIILHCKTIITFTGFGALVFVKTVANCKSQTA